MLVILKPAAVHAGRAQIKHFDRRFTTLCAGAEERRQRAKTAGKGGNADSDAKAAERASDMASKAAKSAAASAAAAKADAETEKSTEVGNSLPLADIAECQCL